MTRALLVILLILISTPAHAQSSPTVTVAWQQGGAALVEWSGLPPGACVIKNSTTMLVDTCVLEGSLVLEAGGVDAAYAPRGGDVFAVVLSGEALARAELGRVVVVLPVVVR